MADSFMIHFACNGKSCYANVYAYRHAPRKYHVHIVNPYLYARLPESLVLIEKDEKLCLLEPKDVSAAVLKMIIAEIDNHRRK